MFRYRAMRAALFCAALVLQAVNAPAEGAAMCDAWTEGCQVPWSFDFDGDGITESVEFRGEWPDVLLEVERPGGAPLWKWRLEREAVCAACSADWYWFPVTFADMDEWSEGREVVVQWYDYAADQGGVSIVSPARQVILATLPGIVARRASGEDGGTGEGRVIRFDRVSSDVP